jgi:hypothetical protein
MVIEASRGGWERGKRGRGTLGSINKSFTQINFGLEFAMIGMETCQHDNHK